MKLAGSLLSMWLPTVITVCTDVLQFPDSKYQMVHICSAGQAAAVPPAKPARPCITPPTHLI